MSLKLKTRRKPMAIKKSIYDTAKSIVENKGKWHTATSKGEDATAYANAAKPSYAALRNNGAGDIADKLEQLDYTQALDYLNTLEVEKEPLTYAEQLDDWYGRQANKSDKTYATIETQGLDRLRGYEDALAYVYGGPTSMDSYNSIINRFAELGESATLGALANTGAENSGNIDSYAKAQAQRQQIAYANAGEEAARAEHTANTANILATLAGKDEAYNDIWGALQTNTSGDQDLYSKLLGYITAADADVKVAENNALAELYKSQTEANDSIYKIAEAATKAWAEGQSEYPTAEAYADYFNSVLNGLTPTAEAPTVDTTYTDEERKGVIDKFATVANDSSLSLAKRMQIISDYTLNAELADIIEHMTDEEHNQLAQIINNLQAQIDGQNTNGEIALS